MSESPHTETPSPSPTLSTAEKSFSVGDRVRLSQVPPYFKTADPMPMLRPPDLIALEDIGTVMEQRAGQTWVVRFERGAVLLDSPYMVKADDA